MRGFVHVGNRRLQAGWACYRPGQVSNFPAPPLPGKLRSLRVFVVEDHTHTLTCLLLYLEVRGHHAAAAASVRETLATLPGAGCDVLISNLCLPDGDGWELLRRVQGRLCQPIYAVAISGLGRPADRQRSRDAGYRHHLPKPFKLAELDAVLGEAARECPATAPGEVAR